MKCRNCGDPVDPRRVEAGYDYCVKEECQRRCVQRVRLAAVRVNKAADYYAKAEEVLPPPSAPSFTASTGAEDDGEVAPRQRRPAAPTNLKGTVARLREKEAQLDSALEANYQRFCRGEITGREMDRADVALVRGFNQVVLAENIRYRGMLRKQSDPRR